MDATELLKVHPTNIYETVGAFVIVCVGLLAAIVGVIVLRELYIEDSREDPHVFIIAGIGILAGIIGIIAGIMGMFIS